MLSIILYFTLLLSSFQLCQLDHIAYNIPDPDCTGVFNLCVDADKERLGREAIKTIHEQMDDDKDGMIEASESTEFIEEELESSTDSIRHRKFQNANLQITLNDLWTQWHHSAVYNWTNDDVVHWLVHHVDLPMYVENFRRNQIDGRMIPRLAANQRHYLSAIMQIRDPTHKRRIIVKSADVVLFGPPQRTHNLIKDIILISALVISFGACIYSYVRHRRTQETMKAMLKELETLQKAESNLTTLSSKVKAVDSEPVEQVKGDRTKLNARLHEMQRMKEEAEKYRKRRNTSHDHEQQFHAALKEIEQLRLALANAEHQSYDPPNELISLLKRTYYVEDIAFEVKRKSVESAMLAAKEQLNKIAKMQRGLFGAVRIAHTDCMDNISEMINSAKQRLSSFHDEIEEHQTRWNRISSILECEDLINYTSSTTTSINYPYFNTYPSTVTNSDAVSNASTDPNNRLKPVHLDSSSSYLNTNNDASIINRTNSNINIRGSAVNPSFPSQSYQADTKSETDTMGEYSNSASTKLKRHIITNNNFTDGRTSLERYSNNSKLPYSNSSNNIDDSSLSLSGSFGRNRSDSTFTTPNEASSMRETKGIIDSVPMFSLDDDDLLIDDNRQSDDGKTQVSEPIGDDVGSVKSSGKGRKSLLSSRLLKSLHNIRSTKKTHIA